VLSWGHGGHGQLGHSSAQNQKVPLRIEVLANERVTSIACGGSSSAAITGKMSDYLFCRYVYGMYVFWYSFSHMFFISLELFKWGSTLILQ
jgi:hypothetical protein